MKSRRINNFLIQIISDNFKDRKIHTLISGDIRWSSAGFHIGTLLSDGILDIERQDMTFLIAYTDHLAIVVVDDKKRVLVEKANEILS